MLDPYTGEGARQRRRQQLPKLVLVAIVAVVIVVAVGMAAWGALRGPTISAYATMPISVTGVAEQSFTVTAEELSQLDCISQEYEGQGKGGASKEVTAYGPLLSTFLAQHGRTPQDFSRVVVTCSDDYTVVITPQMLEEPIVMSIAQGKEPLEEWQWPLRLVIPSEESGKWAYGVASLVFEG